MDQHTDRDDARFLRICFEVARRSRADGRHPFGAILVGPDGAVLLEQGNGISEHERDMTAHAERLLASAASVRFGAAVLAACTLYSSAEPCAMCAGAIYRAGIGRVVHGQSGRGPRQQTDAHSENPTLDLPCRRVFAAGQPAANVAMELLEVGGDHAVPLVSSVTNADGRTPQPLLSGAPLRIGRYELRFKVGAYFATHSAQQPPFFDLIPIRFGISEPEAHYHIPLLVSPGAYSTYRGS